MQRQRIFRLAAILIAVLKSSLILAQNWSPNHAVGTVDGAYNFSYAQTPSQLVELRPPAFPNTGYVYQWEQSTEPTTGFTSIVGGTQSSYTFSGALAQTTYFRRKTMDPGNWNFVYSNIIKISVVSVNWEDLNYVREHDVTTTGVYTAQQVDALPVGQKFQTTTYLDGLGRPIEKVSRETATPANANGLWGDVVAFSQYDAYGKQPVSYLPYTTTTQSGKFKTVPLNEQPQYYQTKLNETSAYSSVTFDNSPLYRVLNMKEPGASWAAGPGKSLSYDLNDLSDDIKIFDVTYVQASVPIVRGVYGANALFKMVSTDENGKQVVEFADNAGRVVLKKVQLDDNPSGPYQGWICTYYVYDDFGQLRYEISPEAVKYLNGNGWSFSGTGGTDVLNNLCFQYYYDAKGRQTWKKTPDAKPLNMLYDVRDRLVFTQDGNQATLPTPQWTATLYDELDRPVVSTLYNTSKSVGGLQTDIANALSSTVTVTNNGGDPVVKMVVIDRNLTSPPYKARESIEFVDGFSSNPGDDFTAEIDPTAVTQPTTVTASVYKDPISATDLNNPAICTVLKYQFYDGYTFTGAKPFDAAFGNTAAYQNSDPNVQAITPTKRTTGFATGSMVRVLGTNTFLSSTAYYDERGLLIQTAEDNIKGGSDVVTSQYHFDGRILSTHSKHTTAGTGYTAFGILTKCLFDKIGRVTELQKSFGSNNPLKTIATYEFDDLGKLKTKHLDPAYTGNGNGELESLTYNYNIHNQLTGINKDYALKSPGTYDKWGHFFGQYLGYTNSDGVFAAGRLNGQLTGVLWNTQGDDAQRKYDYEYDNAGRLTKASFTEQQHPGDGFTATKMDFSVSGYTGKITYDLNGNLLSLLQKGVMPGSSAPITVDDLRYSYVSNSNKLLSVSDWMTNQNVNGAFGDFKDGSNGSNPDYVYDDNGNVVVDLNKNAKDFANVAGANGIHYNFLDKPDQIRLAGKGTINILYTGDGQKLQRTYTPDSGPASTTTYINQFVYQSTGGSTDALSFINMEEGRVRVVTPTNQDNGYDRLQVDGNIDLPNGKRGAFDYFILDYQQNVRMVLTEQTRVASITASMETGRASVEEPLFGQTGGANEVSATRYPTASTGWSGNSTASVSRLGNIAGKNIGPNTLQKVMAGDYVNARAEYYFNAAPGSGNPNPANSLLTSLVQALASGPTSSLIKGTASNITSQLNVNQAFLDYVQPTGGGTGGPKAYLTLLFFDERFNFVGAQDGGAYQQQVASSVDANGSSLNINGVRAPKNGYVYAYLSNQSDGDVYFDNFALTLAQGNIVEENHYYSFGLRIATLSSKKYSDSYDRGVENKYGMQGAFAEMDDDIGWSDFALRNYDAQIGKFVQQDPFGQFYSPYTGMGNDPVNLIDPSGGIGIPCPGTSALAIFMDGALYAIGNALNSISKVGNIVSIGIAVTQTTTVVGNVIGASNVVNGQLETSGVGQMTSGSTGEGSSTVGNPDKESPYWISYDGTHVNIYKGKYGDVSNLYASFGGSSGNSGYELAANEDVENIGPVPQGDYKINLSLDTRRFSTYPLNEGHGVQLLVDPNAKQNRVWTGGPDWGRWRARLDKVNVNSKRNNLYFHDSYKGYSHGCIETETPLFYFLTMLHDQGITEIKVQVKYQSRQTHTYGGTDKIRFSLPENVDPLIKKQISPPNVGRDHPFIPIPKSGYIFTTKLKYY